MIAAQWMDRALCRTADPELFFLPRNRAYTRRAVALCQACPVQLECRDYALTTGQEFGIWGGLTEDDRAALWRHDHEHVRDHTEKVTSHD